MSYTIQSKLPHYNSPNKPAKPNQINPNISCEGPCHSWPWAWLSRKSTLYKVWIRDPWIMIVLRGGIPVVQMEYPYTIPWCVLRKSPHGILMAPSSLYMPTEVSPIVEVHPSHQRPLLCHVVQRNITYGSPHISLQMTTAYTHLPRTTFWHTQT
jgi:hypothetical protein